MSDPNNKAITFDTKADPRESAGEGQKVLIVEIYGLDEAEVDELTPKILQLAFPGARQ